MGDVKQSMTPAMFANTDDKCQCNQFEWKHYEQTTKHDKI
jgi:hypothetical protein